MLKVIIDTNVVLSALKSNQGASYALMTSLPSTKFETALSVPLYTEYQDVLTREKNMTGASTQEDILAYCRYLASISHRKDIFSMAPLVKRPKR